MHVQNVFEHFDAAVYHFTVVIHGRLGFGVIAFYEQ